MDVEKRVLQIALSVLFYDFRRCGPGCFLLFEVGLLLLRDPTNTLAG